MTFTDQQIKQIKTLEASGKSPQAQKVILAEVTREFGGSAAAQATAGDKAKAAFTEVKEQIGAPLIPVLDKFDGLLTDDIVPAGAMFVDGMQHGTGAGGQFAHVLGEIYNDGKASSSSSTVSRARLRSWVPRP